MEPTRGGEYVKGKCYYYHYYYYLCLLFTHITFFQQTLSDPRYKLGLRDQSPGSCRDGVNLILQRNWGRQYLEYCRDVAIDLYENNDHRNLFGYQMPQHAVQNAIHMRMESGLSLYAALHGAIHAVSEGKAIPILNSDGTGDILLPLPGKLEKEGGIYKPICVGWWLRDNRTAEEFYREGPFLEFQYTDCIYFVGIISCQVYPVWHRDELMGWNFNGREGQELLATVVEIGNDYFMGRLKIPSMQLEGGLPTFRYGLKDNTHPDGRRKFSAHQLIGLIKRTFDGDTRGNIARAILIDCDAVVLDDADEISEVLTPEQFLPIRHMEDTVAVDRLDRHNRPIRQADHSETSDQEHGNGRRQLIDNNFLAIRDANHSRNVTFTTVCNHQTEGTGYTNFAHTRIRYDERDHGLIDQRRARDARHYSRSTRGNNNNAGRGRGNNNNAGRGRGNNNNEGRRNRRGQPHQVRRRNAGRR
jgi:hypothetical protein